MSIKHEARESEATENAGAKRKDRGTLMWGCFASYFINRKMSFFHLFFITSPLNREGFIFSLQFVCVSVCLSVCLSVSEQIPAKQMH